MSDITFITDRLATGGECRGPDDVLAVAGAGITHVIDCRAEADDSALFAEYAPHIAYLHNPTWDDGCRKPSRWFDTGVDFAVAALAQPDTKVLAHCAMGVNRGPSMAYAILLALGWYYSPAYLAIKDARPEAGLAYINDAMRWFGRGVGPEHSHLSTLRRRSRHGVTRW